MGTGSVKNLTNIVPDHSPVSLTEILELNFSSCLALCLIITTPATHSVQSLDLAGRWGDMSAKEIVVFLYKDLSVAVFKRASMVMPVQSLMLSVQLFSAVLVCDCLPQVLAAWSRTGCHPSLRLLTVTRSGS